jgi:hypothetical protein
VTIYAVPAEICSLTPDISAANTQAEFEVTDSDVLFGSDEQLPVYVGEEWRGVRTVVELETFFSALSCVHPVYILWM